MGAGGVGVQPAQGTPDRELGSCSGECQGTFLRDREGGYKG